MRLKSIKLAGFKSFVDPTTVPFPSNMTAVVGPNGCGKSNIIDAVRWVRWPHRPPLPSAVYPLSPRAMPPAGWTCTSC